MIDTLADIVVHYGAWLVLAATFLSCLAVPVPTSLVMLSAGAFSAGGDLSLPGTAAAAMAGAVAGDQTGFALGGKGAGLLAGGGKAARMLDRARAFTLRWGGPGVFLSRWLVAPFGPYVNYVAGAARMNWVTFTLWGILGEAVWVTLYIGAGYLFAEQIEAVASLLSNASGAVAGLAATLLLGSWLWRNSRPAATPGSRREPGAD